MFQKASDYKPQLWGNFMIYGPPGTGKTTVGCKLPNCIYILTEAHHTGVVRREGPDVMLAVPKNIKEFDQLIGMVRDGKVKGDWLVIDSLDDIQSRWLDERVAADGKRSIELQHYSQIQTWFRRMITEVRDLPINVLFICKPMSTIEDMGDGKTRTIESPRLIPKDMVGFIMGSVHGCGYTYFRPSKEGDKYAIIFKSSTGLQKVKGTGKQKGTYLQTNFLQAVADAMVISKETLTAQGVTPSTFVDESEETDENRSESTVQQ